MCWGGDYVQNLIRQRQQLAQRSAQPTPIVDDEVEDDKEEDNMNDAVDSMEPDVVDAGVDPPEANEEQPDYDSDDWSIGLESMEGVHSGDELEDNRIT